MWDCLINDFNNYRIEFHHFPSHFETFDSPADCFLNLSLKRKKNSWCLFRWSDGVSHQNLKCPFYYLVISKSVIDWNHHIESDVITVSAFCTKLRPEPDQNPNLSDPTQLNWIWEQNQTQDWGFLFVFFLKRKVKVWINRSGSSQQDGRVDHVWGNGLCRHDSIKVKF